MTKIHVIRNKLQIDIEVDPGDGDSLAHAAGVLKSVQKHVAGLERTTLTILDSRLARVDAPEPADDNLDIPPEPSRTAAE